MVDAPAGRAKTKTPPVLKTNATHRAPLAWLIALSHASGRFTHHPHPPTPLRACRLHGSSCIEVRRRMVRLGRVLARWHPWAEGPRRPSARKCRPLAGTTVRRPDEWRREPRTYNFIGLVLESVCGCPLASARRTLVHPRYTATVLHIPPLTLEQGESESPGVRRQLRGKVVSSA